MASNSTLGSDTFGDEVAFCLRDQIIGKTILITGVSPNGLGAATARCLAKYGPSNLILTARTEAKASAVAEDIHNEFPGLEAKLHVIQIDLADPTSIRQAATRIQELGTSIDIIINNAGLMAIPQRQISVLGVEQHLATNFLGHFLLVNLLLPAYKKDGTKPRVVNIVSAGFNIQPFRFSDYNFDGVATLPIDEQLHVESAEKLGMAGLKHAQNDYNPFLAYAQSSTALMLFTAGLNSKSSGNRCSAFSAAPGVVLTELQRHLPSEFRNQNMVYKTANQGVSSFLVAALDPALEKHPGAHIDNCQVGKVPSHAKNPEAARRLWQLAESWLECPETRP